MLKHFTQHSSFEVISLFNVLKQLSSRIFVIRILIWCFLLIQVFSLLFIQENTSFFSFFLAFSLHLTYFYCLCTNKSEIALGLLHLLSNFFTNLLLLNTSQHTLKFHFTSLNFIILSSVQAYPIIISVIIAIISYGLHLLSIIFVKSFYDQLRDVYMIPEVAMDAFLDSYLVVLLGLVLYIIAHNITIKGLSKELKETKKDLDITQHKLKDYIEEIKCLREQLKKAAQSQDLVVASVSHEFRNPLNILLGNIEILSSSIKDETQLQILKMCKICGNNLLNQINNLLDVAKINVGKLDIHEFPTKMSNFLHEFWTATKQSIEQKGLIGNLFIDKNFPLWVNIDNHRLRQILYNLVDNSIKFTSTGSVKVLFSWKTSNQEQPPLERESLIFDEHINLNQRINSPPKLKIPILNLGEDQDGPSHISFKTQESIQIKLDQFLPLNDRNAEGFIKIEIIDTGCGISHTDKKQVFDPFVQGDRTVTRRYGGLGLGLYIVKRLVQEMGGEITLESKLGMGTHFKVLLPVKTYNETNNCASSELEISDEINVISKKKRKSSNGTSIIGRIPPSSPKKFLTKLNSLSSMKTVLIVDDQEFNRRVMKTYFESLQLETEFACNGLQALQMYQDNPDKYFMVTMDIQMPVMDGIMACKYIRKFEKRIGKKNVPVVIVTGNCNESEKRECLENPEIKADYFFRKPFGLDECKLCVEKILNSQH